MPSTAIRSLSYDEQTKVLFVTFVDGDLYAYFDVPEAVFQAFRRARSKGGFFARKVRNLYRYTRVDDPGGEGASSAPGSGGPASPPPAAGAH